MTVFVSPLRVNCNCNNKVNVDALFSLMFSAHVQWIFSWLHTASCVVSNHLATPVMIYIIYSNTWCKQEICFHMSSIWYCLYIYYDWWLKWLKGGFPFISMKSPLFDVVKTENFQEVNHFTVTVSLLMFYQLPASHKQTFFFMAVL